MLPAPSLAVTQLLSVICNLINCDAAAYASPVSLLPEGFRSGSTRASLRKGRLYDEANSSDIGNSLEEWDTMTPPIVQTKFGNVEGYYMTVVSGRKIFAFEGIPYAESTAGENRFRDPQPKTPWGETLEAKDPGPYCLQLGRGGVKGSEDCLRLNIYTPKIPVDGNNPKLPVLLYIHGGAFIFGSGQNSGPAYLLQEDVILVNFNYRLGILGFFTSGDKEASGNWGMKDQAFAINWVSENIENFGGDPSRIVLMGQSAGAVSVHLQMMSPLARDKFHTAIGMSGGAFNFWGLNTLKSAKEIATNQATLALCPTHQGSKAMMECMRKEDGNVLVSNQVFTPGWRFPVPHVEPDVQGAFLTETPDEAYINGHVAKIPWIGTVTSQESNVVIAELQARRALPLLRAIYDIDGPIFLGLNGKLPMDKEMTVLRKIREFYGAGNGGISLFLPRQFYADVSNARFFTAAFQKAMQMHSQIAPTYGGLFSYPNDKGTSGRLGLNSRDYGVTHNDDLVFLFNSTSDIPIGRNDHSFAFTKLLVNVYSNYAETGIPKFTAEDGKDYEFWDAVKDPQDIKILQIDEEVKMIPNPFYNTTKFWESLNLPDMIPYCVL